MSSTLSRVQLPILILIAMAVSVSSTVLACERAVETTAVSGMPTPDIEQTVTARVAATFAAVPTPTPTPLPTVTPTPTDLQLRTTSTPTNTPNPTDTAYAYTD